MSSTLGVVLPLGLAAAVSPVMLAEQTVLVAGPGGRRAGAWYAAGTALVLLVLCGLVEVFGRAVVLPRAPHLDAALDLVLGVILLALALVVARGGRGSRRETRGTVASSRGRAGSLGAFGFGVLSMVTNLTTLAIVLVAAKDVVASGSPAVEQVLTLCVLVWLATFPAWAPLVAAAAGGPGQAALAALGGFIDRHGRAAVVAVLVAVGAVLVGRGLLRIAGVLT